METLTITLKAASDKKYTITPEVDDEHSRSRYYILLAEGYQISLDAVIAAAGLTEQEKNSIHHHLDGLRDKLIKAVELSVLKESIDTMSSYQYEISDEAVARIKELAAQRLLELGIRESTYKQLMESLSDNIKQAVLESINNLEKGMSNAGTPVDSQVLERGKVNIVKGSSIYSSLAILDLVEGMKEVDDLNKRTWVEQVLMVNAIIDTMNDVREGMGISSHNSRWKFLKRIPKPVRVFMKACLDNPLVRSILFFTMTTSFANTLEAIADGKDSPENYLVLSSISTKLLGMTLTKPLQIAANRLAIHLSQGVAHRLSTKIAMRFGRIVLGALAKRVLIPGNKLFMFVDVGMLLYQYLERGKALGRELPLNSWEVLSASFDDDQAASYQNDILIKNYLQPVKEMAYQRLIASGSHLDGLVYYLPNHHVKYDKIIGGPIFLPNSFGLSTGAEDFEDCALLESPTDTTNTLGRHHYVVNLSEEDLFRELPHEYNDEGFYLDTAFIRRSDRLEFYNLTTQEEMQAYITKKIRDTKNEIKRLSPDYTRKYFPIITFKEYLQGLEYSGWGEGPSSWKVNAACDAPQMDKKYRWGEVHNQFGTMQGPICFSNQIYQQCIRRYSSFSESSKLIKPLVFINGFRVQFQDARKHILYLNSPPGFVAVRDALAIIALKAGHNRVTGAEVGTLFIVNSPTYGRLIAKGENNTLYLNYNASDVLSVTLSPDCGPQIPMGIVEEGSVMYQPNPEIEEYLPSEKKRLRLEGNFDHFISRSATKQFIRTGAKTRYVDVGSSPEGNTISSCVPLGGFQADDVELRILSERNRYVRNQKQTVYVFKEKYSSLNIVGDDTMIRINYEQLDKGIKKENIDLVMLRIDNLNRAWISHDDNTGDYFLGYTSDRIIQEDNVPTININSFRALRLLLSFKLIHYDAELSIYEKSFLHVLQDAYIQRLININATVDALLKKASQSDLEGAVQVIFPSLHSPLYAEKLKMVFSFASDEIKKNYDLNIPLSRVEVKQFSAGGVLRAKMIGGGLYSDTIGIDFSEKKNKDIRYSRASHDEDFPEEVNIVAQGGKSQQRYQILPLDPEHYVLSALLESAERSQLHLKIINYGSQDQLDLSAVNITEMAIDRITQASPLTLEIKLVLSNNGYLVIYPQNEVVISVQLSPYFNGLTYQPIVFKNQTDDYQIDSQTLQVERIQANETAEISAAPTVSNHPQEAAVAHHQSNPIGHDEPVIKTTKEQTPSSQGESVLSKIPAYAWGILGTVVTASSFLFTRRFLQGNPAAVRAGVETIPLMVVINAPSVVANAEEATIQEAAYEEATVDDMREDSDDDYVTVETDEETKYVEEEIKRDELPFIGTKSSGHDDKKTAHEIPVTANEVNSGLTFANVVGAYWENFSLQSHLTLALWVQGFIFRQKPPTTSEKIKDTPLSRAEAVIAAGYLVEKVKEKIKVCATEVGIAYSNIKNKIDFHDGRKKDDLIGKLADTIEIGNLASILPILKESIKGLKGLTVQQGAQFYHTVGEGIKKINDLFIRSIITTGKSPGVDATTTSSSRNTKFSQSDARIIHLDIATRTGIKQSVTQGTAINFFNGGSRNTTASVQREPIKHLKIT